MCNQFKVNRARMLELVYQLDEFTEEEIKEKFLLSNNGDFITDYASSTSDFLFSLCENEILEFDGKYFKVIPPKQRLSYRMHALGVMA